jgi:polycystin 1L2
MFISDSCYLNNQMKKTVDFCIADFSSLNEDKSQHGFNWTQYDSTLDVPKPLKPIYTAFQYKDASTLNGLPYTSSYNTYGGGGYVYELRGSIGYLKANLSMLQSMGWIDRQTRAIFIEFALYNPNLNLFSVCTLLTEFLPTGNLLTEAKFNALNLYDKIEQLSVFLMVCSLIFLLMVICCTINEIKCCYNLGIFDYFRHFWNYIDLFVIIFSWASFGLYIARWSAGNDVAKFFKSTSGYGYINMRFVSYLNETLDICVALCISLSTLKLMKILELNVRLSLLASLVKCCFSDFVSFGVMFLISWMAFVQIFYLVYNDKVRSFSSILKSMQTCFEILLGKFDSVPMMQAHNTVGIITFVIYHFIILFIMVNLFVSIVIDNFLTVKRDSKKHFENFDVVEIIFGQIASFFKSTSDQSPRAKFKLNKVNTYREKSDMFALKVDQLIDYSHQVISIIKL